MTAILSARTSALTDGIAAVPSYTDGVVASDGRFDLRAAELDSWSNRLARMLLRLGAGPGCLVGLAAVPDFEGVAVRHALAKIGAAAVRINAGVFTPTTRVGVTVHARRAGLTDDVHWLVLDDRATLRQYLSTSGAVLTAAEVGGRSHAS
ncbi:AMP-binding protein [Nocardia sp. ET3-3]|uniref:AMP-binding protein n=1 Tax=Nocardia terrae TaxID=2675851 RepID=A0A7K1V387_9NOCA|nr:AMP-binding protein [Nocardia terrae]MVU80909.1 AMP-binding protein [Nocardia terrae]